MKFWLSIGRWIVLGGAALLCNGAFFLLVPLLDTWFSQVPQKSARMNVESVTEVEWRYREPTKEIRQKEMRSIAQDLKAFRVSALVPGQASGLQMDLSLATGGDGDGDGVAVGGGGVENVVYDPTEVDEEARVIKEVQPAFPQRAIKEGVQGFVKLYLVIDAQGRVSEVQVLAVDPPGYGFEVEALKAIRQFQFTPARIKTVPVAQKATKEFVFDLGY